MNHKQVLNGVVVQCPAIPKELAAYVYGFMNRNTCLCADCGTLKRIMRDPPLTTIAISFAQATTILHALRISGSRSDYCLGYCEHLCHLLGQGIIASNETGRTLFELEAAHAHTRELIRMDRLRLWFAREFTELDVEGERFERLMNEVRILLGRDNGEFAVVSENGFHFDTALRNRVRTLANWLNTQIK